MSMPSQTQLEEALSDAGSAHHDYEEVILKGVRDELWSGFYAAYVLGRFGAFTTPSTLSQLLEDAPAGDNWSSTAATYVRSTLNA